MQPAVLAMVGGTSALVSLGGGLAIWTACTQPTIEGVENPRNVIDELRSNQGRGSAQVRILVYRPTPTRQHVLPSLPQMSGYSGELDVGGRCHCRAPELTKCEASSTQLLQNISLASWACDQTAVTNPSTYRNSVGLLLQGVTRIEGKQCGVH
jgi:hypothetical protein